MIEATNAGKTALDELVLQINQSEFSVEAKISDKNPNKIICTTTQELNTKIGM